MPEQINGRPGPVLARIEASEPRRVIGVGALFCLGGFLIYLALFQLAVSVPVKMILIGFGAFVLFGSWQLWRATSVAVELTAEELREVGGRRLAAVVDMREVTRGAFAFKPSNGFLLSLGQPGSARWAPGLWWRIGRRVGVGGVTPAHQGRFMAEQISALIAARQAAEAGPEEP